MVFKVFKNIKFCMRLGIKKLAKVIIRRNSSLLSFVLVSLRLVNNLTQGKKYKHQLTIIDIQKGWILHKICAVIKFYKPEAYVHESLQSIPVSELYFFAHYRAYIHATFRNPHILNYNSIVFFTHFEDHTYMNLPNTIIFLKYARKVCVMNSEVKTMLVNNGLLEKNVSIVYAGVDLDVFFPKKLILKKSRPVFGFCVRYKNIDTLEDRKNYQLIIDVIRSFKTYDFILLGKGWNDFPEFDTVKELPNFRYVETEYSNYALYFNEMDFFVSLSRLEGGPVPLLEAMACNIVPICTRTGFAVDVIEDGKNGFLLNNNLDISDVRDVLSKALKHSPITNIRDKISELSWKNFAKKVLN